MNPIIIDVIQGSDEWKVARAGLATASRFADVMAEVKSGEAASRRNYRADLIVERLTGRPTPSYQSRAMAQGIEREPAARNAYEVKTGNLVDQVGLFRHPELAAACSPDGIIDEDGGLEIKSPEAAAHLRYLHLENGCAPPEYFWQVQGCLWLTHRTYWDFVSYNPDFPEHLQLVTRRVYRDEAGIKKLAEAVERFMDEVRAEEASVRALPQAA